jgi:hypothetical protein
MDRLQKVQNILVELHEYKPLTLRQVYYQMVGKGFIENNWSQYTAISKLLKWSRLNGSIDWNDIEDRSRSFQNLSGWKDNQDFVNHEIDMFLKGYRRDLLQTQDRYIEVWLEKDALTTIFKRACDPYSISVMPCRGFSSMTALNDFRTRLYHTDQEPTILYFGDFDPSGMEMEYSMNDRFDEMNVNGIKIKRISLLKQDIFDFNLLPGIRKYPKSRDLKLDHEGL